MASFSRFPARMALTAVLMLLLLAGCDQWPADPRHSLDSARERGTLRVGVVHSPPWVELTDRASPAGLEVELISEFAAALGLEVEWHTDGVEQQTEALKQAELDILLGGFSSANPWRAEVGQTFVYFREQQGGALGKHVMLTAPGENALLMELERFLLRQPTPERYTTRLREADPS